MSDAFFNTDWRPRQPGVRRFLAHYLRWMIWGGYLFCLLAGAGIVAAFVIRQNETITTNADDPATIAAVAETHTVDAPVFLRRKLVGDGTLVAPGQVVAEVSLGPAAPLAVAVFQLRGADRQSAALPDLERRLATFPVLRVQSRASGVLIWGPEGDTGLVDAGKDLFRVVDYGRVQITGKLRGNSVAKGAEGQTARISSIDFNRDAKDLIRGTLDTDGKTLTFGSRSLLNGSVETMLNQDLKGQDYATRNDRTFRFDRVSLAEVEVEVTGQPTTASDKALAVDPDRDFLLDGNVVSGKHWAKVQFRTLPPDVQTRLKETITQRLQGQVLAGPPDQGGKNLDGAFAVGQVRRVEAIVQAEALATAETFTTPTPGNAASVVDRYFEATANLTNPPEWLVRALRANDLLRRSTRAKLEVVTGSSPYALQLLRR